MYEMPFWAVIVQEIIKVIIIYAIILLLTRKIAQWYVGTNEIKKELKIIKEELEKLNGINKSSRE
jgi:hypothetical protein